jgi:short-subunit dehydrogenase
MPTALVTGASMGIGAVFARELATRQYNLVLAARSEDKLHAIAEELQACHGIKAEVIVGDLTDTSVPQSIFETVASWDWSIDLLINNAGFGDYGEFATRDRDKQLAMLQLNIMALVELTHLFLPAMQARRSGGIINVASIAAFQPMPYLSVYAATKAFVLSFSEAIRAENRYLGIKVQCLCPGATESNFAAVSGLEKAFGTFDRKPSLADATFVVRESLTALERDQSIIVTGGVGNKIGAGLSRVLSSEILASFVEKVFRPKYDNS